MMKKLIVDVKEPEKVIPILGEFTEKEVRLCYVIGRICDYLTYFDNNSPTGFGNPDYAEKQGWIAGFFYGAKAEFTMTDKCVSFKLWGYDVLIR